MKKRLGYLRCETGKVRAARPAWIAGKASALVSEREMWNGQGSSEENSNEQLHPETAAPAGIGCPPILKGKRRITLTLIVVSG